MRVGTTSPVGFDVLVLADTNRALLVFQRVVCNSTDVE